MSTIEDVIKKQQSTVGAVWVSPISLKQLIEQDRVRIAATDNALLIEIDKETWTVPESSRLSVFPPSPPDAGSLDAAWSCFSVSDVAGISQCPSTNVEANWPAIYAALETVGQASPRSLIAAIATIAIETASTFKPCRELYNDPPGADAYFEQMYGVGSNPNAAAMGNTQPGDGAKYFGRGYIQLTWKSNYASYGQKIGVDLVSNPDLALDPNIAARIFAQYWRSHDIQSSADAEDWVTVRSKVQGGSAGLPRLITIAQGLLPIARARGRIV